MASAEVIRKHFARIIRRWPKDELRPITFQDVMQRRLARRIPNGSDAPPTIDLVAEQQQANALYSLLENRYSSKYPTSESLLRPTSNPDYYTNLLAEMEAAPRRSWLTRQWLRWSNLVRLS